MSSITKQDLDTMEQMFAKVLEKSECEQWALETARRIKKRECKRNHTTG